MLAVLARAPDLFVLDLGKGTDESLERLDHEKPQVLLVDLPNGELSALVRRAHIALPRLTILALNRGESEAELLPLFEAGLSGYIPPDAGPNELSDAIRAALRGEVQCAPRITAALVRRLNVLARSTRPSKPTADLTPREWQIAQLLEQGLSNKEIAGRLGIEPTTAKNHVHHILEKLAVRRRGEAASRLRGPKAHLRVVRGKRNAPIDRMV